MNPPSPLPAQDPRRRRRQMPWGALGLGALGLGGLGLGAAAWMQHRRNQTILPSSAWGKTVQSFADRLRGYSVPAAPVSGPAPAYAGAAPVAGPDVAQTILGTGETFAGLAPVALAIPPLARTLPATAGKVLGVTGKALPGFTGVQWGHNPLVVGDQAGIDDQAAAAILGAGADYGTAALAGATFGPAGAGVAMLGQGLRNVALDKANADLARMTNSTDQIGKLTDFLVGTMGNSRRLPLPEDRVKLMRDVLTNVHKTRPDLLQEIMAPEPATIFQRLSGSGRPTHPASRKVLENALHYVGAL